MKKSLATVGAAYRDYDYHAKEALHHCARAKLRAIAKALGLAAGSYEIRSNKAGPAVSGEITLQGEQIYVQVAAGCGRHFMGDVLVRTCSGRKDYCGHQNYFAQLAELDEPEQFAAKLAAMIERRFGAAREEA